MEKLKHYDDILALGRLLVEELGLKQSTDTLGRWMAHHISELIIEVEKNEGSDKSDVADQCRDAVLALWNHIWVFQRGHRPLENIEPLLATIEALAPENQAPFYQVEGQTRIEQSTLSDQAKNFLELSLGIDYTARLLIEMCLKNVANEINEEKSSLLGLAKSLDLDTPLINVVESLSDEQEQPDGEEKSKILRETIKTLRNRRERLRKMLEISEVLASSIDNDIKNLEQSLV